MTDAGKPGIDPRFDPAFQRGFSGPHPSAESAPAPADRSSGWHEPTQPAVEVAPAHVPEPEPVAARGNPWLRTLWIIAGTFTIGGVLAQWQSQILFSTPNGENAIHYYVVPSILDTMSPWFTFAGLIAGIGAVFIAATRWRAD